MVVLFSMLFIKVLILLCFFLFLKNILWLLLWFILGILLCGVVMMSLYLVLVRCLVGMLNLLRK